MSNFHPLEVVDRGSETQLQMGENLNLIMYSSLWVDTMLNDTTLNPTLV